ncbi:peptidase inhibitor family I36 protein [Nonomuraea sp. NPDC048882]|uniref:peptidase inhibitor family I36 protein n=1 Tax=unclassified Nonomuraea TaxID=2593643 RepID=UPI0033CD896E
MKSLSLLLTPVLAAAVVAAPAAPVQAAAPACHAHVCLWTGANYTGAVYTWWEANGNRFIGGTHADNVGSFVATSGACFVDTADTEWNWRAKRLASAGDYSSNYRGRFGGVMDRIAPARYC